MGGEPAGGQTGQEQAQVVAVRSDEVGAAVDLAGVELIHGALQARGQAGLIEERLLAGEPGRLVMGVGLRVSLVSQQARAVGDLGTGALPGGPGDGFVGGGHPGAQAPHDVDPGGDEPGGRRGELGVPDLQGGEHGGGRGAGRARGLQKAGALGEDLVVLSAHPGQARAQRDDQVVEEASADPGLGAHQGEVLGGEDDRAQHSEQVAGPAAAPVEAGPIRLAGDDLDLQDAGSFPVDGPGTHDGAGRLGLTRCRPSDEGGVRADPVGGEGRQIDDGLDQVGLALPVGADEGAGARLQGQHQAAVGAEVVQGEVRDVHAPSGLRPRSGSA